MQRNGLSTDGPMVKALDGVYANLRWDIGVSSYPFYWETLNHKDAATATYQLLSNFAVGVAGGGGISRADYIYDNVNLPEVSVAFNNMVQSLLDIITDLVAGKCVLIGNCGAQLLRCVRSPSLYL